MAHTHAAGLHLLRLRGLCAGLCPLCLRILRVVVEDHRVERGLIGNTELRDVVRGVGGLFRVVRRLKFHAVEHIDLGRFRLRAHDGALVRVVDHVIRELRCVRHRGAQRRVGRVRLRADHAGDLQLERVFHELFRAAVFLLDIGERAVVVLLIAVAGRHKPEAAVRGIGVIPVERFRRFAVLDRRADRVVFVLRDEAELVERIGGDGILLVEHEHHLVVIFRPRAVEQVVAVGDDGADGALRAGHQLLKIFRAAVGAGHHRHGVLHVLVHHGGEARFIPALRVLADIHARIDRGVVRVAREHIELDVVRIDDAVFTEVLRDLAFGVVEVIFKGRQVVFGDARLERFHSLELPAVRVHAVLGRGVRILHGAVHGSHRALRLHQRRHVEGFGRDRQRIGGHRLLLDVCDVLVHAGRKREDQRDADDADRPRERGEERAALLRAQVVEAQRERGEKAHGGAPHVFVLRRFERRLVHRKGV